MDGADDCKYRAKSHDGVKEVRLSHSFSIHGERPRNAYGERLRGLSPIATISAHGDSPLLQGSCPADDSSLLA